MKYLRLTREDRYQIQALIATGQSIRQVSRQLSRHPSTILRELRKGASSESRYSAHKADLVSRRFLYRSHPELHRIRGEVEQYVLERLRQDWSPEQIAGRMRLDGRGNVAPLTIYRYVRRDRLEHGQLWRHLRILRKLGKDKKRPNYKPRRYLPNRVPIECRPEIVEKRIRLGDYERDTVLGKRGKSVLLTIVDRRSRLLKLACLRKGSCELAHTATVSLLKNEPLHTITNDNGFEFLWHHKTAKALRTQVYFSKAYRSWERGTNENTNGLLRQYFPKKKDIGSPTKELIRRIEHRLNSRPRKILGYRTPLEVHRQLKLGAVALDV